MTSWRNFNKPHVMSITEAIVSRKSVRSFTGQPLSPVDSEALRGFVSGLEAPFGANARIILIGALMDGEPVKLGTYGIISGASDFLVLLYEEGFMAEQAAGYLFEQAVLRATQMGLGTCWLGGTFNKKDFVANTDLRSGELLRIVSPVGYPAKRKLTEKIMRAGAGSDSRKPFGNIFFNGGFDAPLLKENAGRYLQPLEMVRLAPSASNTQPWRVILDGETLHFYYHRDASRFSTIDMGIALCHFEQTCVELGVPGRYEALPDMDVPDGGKNKYAVSWVSDNPK